MPTELVDSCSEILCASSMTKKITTVKHTKTTIHLNRDRLIFGGRVLKKQGLWSVHFRDSPQFVYLHQVQQLNLYSDFVYFTSLRSCLKHVRVLD